MRSQNFLIPDAPEFYEAVDFFPRKPKKSIPYDIKNTTLAVATFSHGSLLANDDTKAGRFLREENKALADVLAQIYPFPYEMAPFHGDSQTLYKKGFKYVLLGFRGRASAMKKDLKDPFKDLSKGGYVEAGHENEVVYKFCIQQVHPRMLFVGSAWDATPSLEAALTEFLSDFRKEEQASGGPRPED